MTVSGPTQSGKTYFVKKLLEEQRITPLPQIIIWIYKRWQPLYDEMLKTIPNIRFIQGIPNAIDKDNFFSIHRFNLVILDDMMTVSSKDPRVADLFTEGSHHRNLSVINLTQNLFPNGKSAVTLRRNTHYMVIFKSPMGQDQIKIFGGYIYPTRVAEFLNIYHRATDRAHGYLVVDGTQNCPEDLRLRNGPYINNNIGERPQLQCNDQTVNVSQYPVVNKTAPVNMTQPSEHYPQQQFQVQHYGTPHRMDTGQRNENIVTNEQDRGPDLNGCMDCGAVYVTSNDLQRHLKRGCPEDDNSDDENPLHKILKPTPINDDSGFNSLIGRVYEMHDDEYGDRINALMKQRNISDKKARDVADEEFLPKWKKSLMKKYREILVFMHNIEGSPTYDEIGDAIEQNVASGYSYDKAVSRAVRSKQQLFEHILEDAESSDEEERSDSDEAIENDD